MLRLVTGQQMITIHILPNISTKFGHLTKYNVSHKSWRKWGRETSSCHVLFSEKAFSFNIFWKSSTWTCNKTNCMKFWTVDPEIYSILIFKKVSGTSFPTTFYVWFFKKNISHVTFYSLTKYHCLDAFTFCDIEQYVYCNYLQLIMWRHKFLN